MSSYIGCKISLISKAGIRYEGVLYTIDPKESTVALSKVKSFGTEDRKVDRPIAARDEIYEYIIFRGSDISDLNVCEPYKEMTLLNEDSAIVRAETSSNTQHTNIVTNENVTDQWVSNNRNINSSKHPNIKETELTQTILMSPLSNQNTKVNNETKKTYRRQEHYKNDYNHSEENKANKAKTKNDRYSKSYEKNSQGYYDYDYDYGYDASYNYRGYRYQNDYQSRDYYYQPKQSAGRYRRNDYRKDQNQTTDGNKLRGFESSELMNNRDHHYSQYYDYRPTKTNPEKRENVNRNKRKPNNLSESKKEGFKEDYDFETANAIIAKELENLTVSQDKKDLKEREIDKEDGEISESSDVAFYDKAKSFFDNISSEVTDRANGKTVRPMNRKDERKMNVETFGMAETNRGGRMRVGTKWGNNSGRQGNNTGRGYNGGNGRYNKSYMMNGGGGTGSNKNMSTHRRPVTVGGPGRGDDY